MRLRQIAPAFVWWCVVVLTVTVTLWETPTQLRRLHSDIEVGSRSRLYRELQPARTAGLSDLRPFVVAKRVVPARAHVYLAISADGGRVDRRALTSVQPFARYWLLPRRLTPSLGDADWVLTYGTSLERLGVSFDRVIRISRGVRVARIARPR